MTAGPESNPGAEKIGIPKAWLQYGLASHEREYIFATEENGPEGSILAEIEEVVQAELGENWRVDNRGTRIEVTCKEPYGARDDQKVRSAFEKALDQLEQKYNFLP